MPGTQITAGGCSSARVEVDVERETVRFGEFVIDTIGCPLPWDATVELLRAGEARYSITAARLTLAAGDVGVAAVAFGEDGASRRGRANTS